MELVSAAREFETRSPDPSLAAFIDQLSLLSDVDEEAGTPDAKVVMMTLHSAKGLEFPVVIITGLEEGLLPHSRSSQDDAELEEERRLCYVGITRAQRRLVLASAARRRVFGEYQQSSPSRFIEEIPAKLLEEVPLDLCSGSLRVLAVSRRIVKRARAGRATDVQVRRRGSVCSSGLETRTPGSAPDVWRWHRRERRTPRRRRQAGRSIQQRWAEDAQGAVRPLGGRLTARALQINWRGRGPQPGPLRLLPRLCLARPA